jgi:hypothetical protein
MAKNTTGDRIQTVTESLKNASVNESPSTIKLFIDTGQLGNSYMDKACP